MFDVEKLWIYGKNKNWKNRFKNSKNNTLPVISGVTVNNGVNYYTNDLYDEKDVFTDSLTISTRGEYSGTVTYHKGKFLLANNILVMQMPNFTLLQKIFIGSLINKLPYGGYNGYPRKETLKNNIIQLPTKDGKIDFEFMEYFIAELEAQHIAELEAQHIAELEAYLKATALNNYELTSDEKKSIDNFNSIKWSEYRIGDLFEKIKTNNVTKNSAGDLPATTAILSNNQIGKYINRENATILKNVFSATANGSGKSFYQPYDFTVLQDSYAFKFKDDLIKINKIHPFINSCLNKIYSKYNWGNKSGWEKIKQEYIKLPTKDGEIDFEYIELFTTAIQKLVIKDVVIYANNKISTTKNVCNSK